MFNLNGEAKTASTKHDASIIPAAVLAPDRQGRSNPKQYTPAISEFARVAEDCLPDYYRVLIVF